MWQLNENDDQLLQLALKEDLGSPYCDITSSTLFPDLHRSQTIKIVSKEAQEIVICGIPIINAILTKLNSDFELLTSYQDGSLLKSGEILLTVQGDTKTLLTAERIILNFLRHLSAISTLTKQFCDAVQHTPLKILDTRKTTPGLRHLEKYAVSCGGGTNHRMGLYDAFMIKDTHIDLLGGLEKALQVIPSRSQNNLPVIVEIRNMNELETAMQYGKDKITRVLLDNMKIDLLQKCVALCNNFFETEASGNINLNNVAQIAETGVQYASVGMLTYNAGQVDLSIQAVQNQGSL